MVTSDACRRVLQLTLTPGVGPVLGRRLIETLGSPGAAINATGRELAAVRGVGEDTASRIVAGRGQAEAAVEKELRQIEEAGARLVSYMDEAYPALLREIPGAPLLLYVKGTLPAQEAWHTVAIVGSRRATAYGVEQAERFSQSLAQAGLTIVSGGARGIDTAAHRAALRIGGRTIAVIGSGLARPYPPENAELYDRIVHENGAIVSELPMNTPPAAENFPSRNRIISGIALGVLVVEAPARSGALITARYAGGEHGREVMAIPGRIDSPSSGGSNELIREGVATLTATPTQVIEQLERQAWHLHNGTHAARFRPPVTNGEAPASEEGRGPPVPADLSAVQQAIIEALGEPRTVDELCRLTEIDAAKLATEATVLELKRLIRREGSRLVRVRGGG